jgi:hypothetical protein
MKSIVALAIFSFGIYFAQAGTSINAPLPVKMVKVADQSFAFFRVHRQADDASLNWGISNPVAAASFVIERSYDGVEFEEIATVPATGSASYRYRDNTVFPGFSYFRITCVNTDGTEAQSDVQDLRIVKRK